MRRFAKGVPRPQRGTMNKTEAKYAACLEEQKQRGAILWYAFESVTLRLAKRTSYTPDFIVMLADGTLEAHEVKGFWQDDARVKIKVAAAMFPMHFRAIKAAKGGMWSEEYIEAD